MLVYYFIRDESVDINSYCFNRYDEQTGRQMEKALYRMARYPQGHIKLMYPSCHLIYHSGNIQNILIHLEPLSGDYLFLLSLQNNFPAFQPFTVSFIIQEKTAKENA